MKKHLLFSASFFVLVTLCNAQTNVYHPFPDSNAVWGMSSGCFDTNCGDWQYIKDYYGGDTLIDGNNYKKIVEEVYPMTNGNCCPVPNGSGAGLLRDDTIAKKVYWRAQWMSNDTLLYDFTLQVGDTVNDFLQCEWGALTVVSIDSILIGGSYRKRINFDYTLIMPYQNYSIIEGIGSTDGLTVPNCNTMGFGTFLNCFSENDIVLYSHGLSPDTIPCGTLPVGVNNLHQQTKEMVTVFPNPATEGEITFKFENTEYHNTMELKCFDIFGREVFKEKIYRYQGEGIVDVSGWGKGMCFAVVYADGKPIGQVKFVVQ